MTSRRSLRGHTAFTLIEVVMAMAIVAFALLAITGLLPVGLQSVRDTANDQAVGAISTQLRGQLQQINFTTGLPTLAATINYYDGEGVLIPTANPANMTPYYKATFALSNSAYGSTIYTAANSQVVYVTLAYPAPAYNQTLNFSLLATSQVGL